MTKVWVATVGLTFKAGLTRKQVDRFLEEYVLMHDWVAAMDVDDLDKEDQSDDT
jgi:hypothetical protein